MPADKPADGDTSGVTVLPPLIYLAGLVIGYLVEWLWPVPIAPGGLAVIVRVIGVIAVLAGLWLIFSAATLFRSLGTEVDPHKPASVVAIDGPYRFTRNPMYLGMALVLAGLAFIGNALWPLIAVIPVVWWIQTQVIAKEEAYLERKFGAPYLALKARVRRWL
jgi:protein-S-isoprenylcysteine O-methyltransferase Ste14